MNHQFNLFLSDQKGFVELPLLEGGVYICCPASEEEVRSDLNPIYQIDLIFQLNSQFAIHCEFPYCFKVDTALKKQVLQSINHSCCISFQPKQVEPTSHAKQIFKALRCFSAHMLICLSAHIGVRKICLSADMVPEKY